MPDVRLKRGERVFVDLTSPLSSMLFPVLELIVITGVCAMVVGFLDQLPGWDGTSPADNFPPELRGIVLLVWVVAFIWRFVMPLIRQRRYRLTITSRRVIARPEGVRTRTDSIPLNYVYRVSRRRSTLALHVAGEGQPYLMRSVPKAKRVENILKDLTPR